MRQKQTSSSRTISADSVPTLPWQRVASDLFEWKKANYLLIIDYFSRWIEISKLELTTSSSVINHMQSVFARHGITETVVSDNGPQYSSEIFSQFANEYTVSDTSHLAPLPSGQWGGRES